MSREPLLSTPYLLATTESAVGPTLLPVSEVARMLGLSARTVWRLDSGGLLPQSVTLGSSKRWRRDELLDWIKAGCPARPNWQWEQVRRTH